MSEPIRTVEELADEFSEMIDSANRTFKEVYWPGLTRFDLKFHATRTFHHANRILDYLGLDCCKDGETPRKRIERERKDTDALLELLAAEKRRAEGAERRTAELESTLRAYEAATGATRELIVAWDAARDALAAVRGALMDAGKSTVETNDEDLADGVRRLEAERDRYRDALVALAQKHFADTVEGRRELLIAAGLNPDTLGVE